MSWSVFKFNEFATALKINLYVTGKKNQTINFTDL